MAFDIIIRGGLIATASDTFRCDIGVAGGRITALGEHLGAAKEIVDAIGKLVLPGGIDSHVHIAQPSDPDIVMADDFASATRSAAFGGNTMVLPFAMQQKGQSLREVVSAYHAKAEGCCYVDVSFHLIIADASDAVLGQELPALVADGYTSFKVFMTYEGLALSDMEMLNVMSVARQTGALVMVHAENYDAIRFLTDRLERAGKTAPHFHGVSRPIPVEREATHRAISLSELVDVPVMIVHVSNGEAMEEIRRAQGRGLKVYGETCPQYLVLTEKDMQGLNMEGAKYVCSPPPRDEASQQACWQGLRQGVFSVFSSDHCPFGAYMPRAKSEFARPAGMPS
jgi:dihydropyrimidinase